MPRLTAWSLRIALLYLLAGFTLGGLLLANKGVPFSPQIWLLLSAHVEFVLVGWMVQMAVSVAFWILPRFPGGSRGNEKLAWAAVGLLNLGILLAAAQTVIQFTVQALAPGLALAGYGCQALAGVLFAWHAWKRVRPLYPAG